MILMIDNYDSFTYNIVHYLKELGQKVVVKRNDAVTLDEIAALKPQFIVISPGPSHPGNAGICLELIRHFKKDIPILGICLGHQCIGVAFGAKIIKAQKIYHGKFSEVTHDDTGVFRKLNNPLKVVRYHSLAIDPHSLPPEIVVNATSEDGEIMGIKHQHFPLQGVQFHPESIGSEQGHELLNNFLISN